MNAPGVYAIVNGSNERTYIGSSHNVPARWGTHRSRLRSGTHRNVELQREWNDYGERMFAFVQLEEVVNREERFAREALHLRIAHDPYNASQVRLTGPRPGHKLLPHQIAKMRLAMTGRPKSAQHRANLSRAKAGKKCPAQSLVMMGRKPSVETREKMRLAHLGMKASPESRAKQSLALKGRIVPASVGRAISLAKKGKPNPAQSQRLLGKPLSAETRKRMSEAHRKPWSQTRRDVYNKSTARAVS